MKRVAREFIDQVLGGYVSACVFHAVELNFTLFIWS